jgi:inosine-uridine nucleoside N-ribohydrolase
MAKVTHPRRILARVLRRDAIAFVAMIAFAFACHRQPAAVDVLIDQDGAIDDLIAVALLLRSPEVRVHAITLIPGDSFLEPATRATQRIVDSLGGSNIVIGRGHSEGRNPFPDAWRKDASRVLDIPAAILDPRVITTERLKIRVVTTGESQGRTVEEADGVPVDVALRADQQRVERMFLDVLAR